MGRKSIHIGLSGLVVKIKVLELKVEGLGSDPWPDHGDCNL